MGKAEKIRNINDEFRNFPSQKLNKLSNDRFKFLYLVKRKALESEDECVCYEKIIECIINTLSEPVLRDLYLFLKKDGLL